MKVIFNRLPFKRVKCVATVGVFDGIHLGHQFILRKVREAAREKGLSSLLITFDISPQQFLNKKKLLHHRRPEKAFTPLEMSHSEEERARFLTGFIGSLTDRDDKIDLVSSLGIDYLWFLKTKRSFLGLSAKSFINYIQKCFNIEKLIVGEDFRFGHKGTGDLSDLRKLAGEHKFNLSIIRKKTKNNKVISSSLIRQLIQKGKLSQAKQLLGRCFSLKGRVVKGRGIGSKLGFPTANISASDYLIPACGVYAAYVVLGKKTYLSAINIGILPKFGKVKGLVVEAHVLNFKKNILGEPIKIVFLERLREEKNFPSSKDLVSAISKDIKHLTSKYGAFLT